MSWRGALSGFLALLMGAALFLKGAAWARPLAVKPNVPYLVDVWEIEDGLPQSSVTSIIQTPDGYLWLGTGNGLARFDGMEFKVFDRFNTPGFPGSEVTALYFDSRERLWVSTERGIACLASNEWRAYGTNEGWREGLAIAFVEDAGGRLLVAGSTRRLMQFEGDRFVAVTASGMRGPAAGFLVFRDKQGRIWGKTSRFLGYLGDKRWVPVWTDADTNFNLLTAVGPASDGAIWVADTNYLRKYKDGAWGSERSAPDPRADSGIILEDSHTNVWMTSLNGGLWRFTGLSVLPPFNKGNGLPHNSVRSIFEDREGNLWIGTDGGGLARFKPRTFATYADEPGVLQNKVRSVAAEGAGRVWVGTHGGGVAVWEHGGDLALYESSRFRRVTIPKNRYQPNSIGSVLVDRSGKVWVGTVGNGLFQVSQQASNLVLETVPAVTNAGGFSIHALQDDSQGALWIGTERGLMRFSDGQVAHFTNEGLTAKSIRVIREAGPLEYWVGSEDAGAFRTSGGRFVPVRTSDAGLPDQVWAIHPDTNGTVWIGSVGHGLFCWRNGKLFRFPESAQLPARDITCILDDGLGYLWVGSDRGIFRVSRTDLENVAAGQQADLRWLQFARSDGLLSTECAGGGQPTATRDARGQLWFATWKGLSKVDPATISVPPDPPAPIITKVVVDGKPMEPSGQKLSVPQWGPGPLRIPPEPKRIEIHYASLSFAAPENIRFRTKVNGIEADWTLAADRRVSYLRAPAPGEYRFEVQSRRSDGTWNPAGATLRYVVLPFYWQTWWFRWGGGFILTAAVAFSGWLASRRKFQRKVERLEQEKTVAVLKARLASILENTSDFVSFASTEGRTIYINQAGRRLIGLSEDTTVEDHRMQEFYPAWAAKKVSEEGLPQAAAHGAWQGESALLNREGAEIAVSQVIVAHHEANGPLSFFSTIARDIRTAKQAERALREREETYRIVAEQTGQMVYDGDLKSGRIRWAGAILATTGYTPEEFNTLIDSGGWQAHIHTEDRRAVLETLERALVTGAPLAAEYRFRRKDGSYVSVSHNGVLLGDEQGRSVRMLGAIQDVTQRKSAESTRELLRRLAQALTAPLTTREIALLLARECRERFGYHAFFLDLTDEATNIRLPVYCEDTPVGETLPREVPSAVDPSQPHLFRTLFRGEPLLLNRAHDPPAGEVTPWGFKERLSRSLMMAPVQWEGRCIGVLSVQSYSPGKYARRDLELLQDIADHCGAAVMRAQADAALRDERNFVTTVLNTVSSLVVVLDSVGRIVRFNEACIATTGYAVEEVLGRFIWDFLLVPEEIEGVKAVFRRLTVGDFPTRHENYWVTRDGRRRWIAWANTVLLDKDGKVQFIIGTGVDMTEQRKTEQALRQSEQRYQLAVRGSTDGLWDWNLLTNEVFYSDRYKELLGYAPAEFPNRYEAFADHLHPDDRPRVEAAQRAHLGEHAPYDIEYRLRTKAGAYRWIRSRAQAIWDESGRPVRMAGSHTDVTDRRMAEEAWRQSEALLTHTNRLAQVGGWELDLETNRLSWTSEVYLIHEVVAGFSPTLDDSIRFFAVEYQDDLRHAYERCRHHGEPWDLECELITAAGRRLWVRTQGEAQYDHGRVRRLIGSIQDITRRKRAEGALRAVAAGTAGFSGEDFFRSLVQHLAAALQVKHAFIGELISTDPERIRAICSWTGDGPGEPFEFDLANTPCAQVVGGELCFFPHSVRERFPHDKLLAQMAAESYVGVPLFDAAKRPLGLLAVVHDQPLVEADASKSIVTIFAARAGAELERIRAEREVRSLNAELEQRVRERTAQLVAANHELQAFSYSVSHDLRAPLRHLAGFTNLLVRNPTVVNNADALRQADIINQAARKMGQLIDDLLVFSRMGRAELKHEAISMTELLREVIHDLQPDLVGRSIAWQIEPLPEVMADPAMLRQVWLNLLSNAIKYTRYREQAVIAVRGEQNDRETVFSVRDNGAGFDMSYADKLFGVFHRLHRDEEFEGTGIGLANVRRIIHRHGGHTWATGEPDKGASFFFTLPRKPVEHGLLFGVDIDAPVDYP